MLDGHTHEDYVAAFRWTVLILAAITAGASRVFSQLRHDRPPAAAPAAG